MNPRALRAALAHVPPRAPMTLRAATPDAVLCVDHALFHRRADRVDAARLEACMADPTARFVLAGVEGPEGWLPIGYTGWFPLRDADRDALLAGALDRRQLRPGDGEAAYLFAWGLLAPWRSHGRARALLCDLGAAVADRPQRLALIVTPAGARVATRFGLRATTVRFGHDTLWASPGLSASPTG
jgi:hypothetical protein